MVISQYMKKKTVVLCLKFISLQDIIFIKTRLSKTLALKQLEGGILLIKIVVQQKTFILIAYMVVFMNNNK